MLFSQRNKLKPVRSFTQREEMDDALRCGLWNALYLCIWENINSHHFKSSNLYILFQRYWHSYFHKPIDNIPDYFDGALENIREYFMKCTWYEVYDFIEFTAKYAPDEMTPGFKVFCNSVLSNELSAYRFVENQLTEITSELEIASVEDALKNTSPFEGVNIHLKTALALLSDRKQPDYRNSIKESICAVEALAQIITNDDKASLGSALKSLESRGGIHPALQKSLSALYGYTSDADGIRHAMLEDSELTYADAKFILVSCTAFTNYLIHKSSKKNLTR